MRVTRIAKAFQSLCFALNKPMLDTDIHLQALAISCIRQQKTLFANLSFQLTPGQLLLIEGPNGSGKSSLLRLLTGLSTPASGSILWRGTNIQHLQAEYWHHMHYIGHTNGIKLGLTVIENLRLMHYLSLETATNQFESVLTELALHDHKNIPATNLSAGQKRRLALAKLFLLEKKLWILDEPLTALDKDTQTLFFSRLKSHLKNGGMGIVTSHHPLHVNGVDMQTLRLVAC